MLLGGTELVVGLVGAGYWAVDALLMVLLAVVWGTAMGLVEP